MRPDQCFLCDLSSREENSGIWRSLNENGYGGVVEWSGSRGVHASLKSVRSHFEYHMPVQSVGRRFTRAKQTEMFSRMKPRPRQLVDLIFRVPGLTSPAIGRLLYWNGDQRKLTAADKAAARDLKNLMRKDICFRAFISNLSGPTVRPTDQKGMFYAGTNARALVEVEHDVELRGKDLITSVSDLGDWRSSYPKARSAEVISRLLLEMPGSESVRWATVNGETIGFDYRSWLGSHLLPTFTDPLREGTKVKAGGIFALSHLRDEGTAILPFFYFYDSGSRPVEQMVDDLQSSMRLERSGQVSDFYPDIDPLTVIPYVVISSSRERLMRLREAAARAGAPKDRFIAMACVESELSLGHPVFIRLFQDAEPAPIVDVLVSYFNERPVLADHLRWSGVRGKTAAH